MLLTWSLKNFQHGFYISHLFTNLTSQSTQETTAATTTTTNTSNFTQSNSTTSVPVTQAIGSEIQDLIMHHQSHATTTAGK